MKPITKAHIQRPHDAARRRQPLRLEIARRRAHTRSGTEKFVTEVRYGDAAALFVPWSGQRRRAPGLGSGPDFKPPVETALA